MDTTFWQGLAGLATSLGIVWVSLLAFHLITRWRLGPIPTPTLPRTELRTSPWFALGFYILWLMLSSWFVSALAATPWKTWWNEPSSLELALHGAVAGSTFVTNAEASSSVRQQRLMLYAVQLSVPLLLLLWRYLTTNVLVTTHAARVNSPRWDVSLRVGLRDSLVVLPVVLGIHITVLALASWMNAVTQNHAMTTLGLGRTWWETILFAVGILVWIPWMEEFLFRRLLLRAAMRQTWVAAGLCIFAGCIAGVSAAVQPVGPILWVIGTILGLLMVWRFVPRRRRRTILGLGSTSLLFAAMHASVWPSPVPLFFLALALGWVYLRTGRLAGAILLHGLFNSVAWIYLALTVSQG